MNHSYNNSNYDFFGLKSDKKKKTEQESYPYRAKLGYDSAPSLLGRIASNDNNPSLFAPQSEGERIRKMLQSTVDKALGKGKNSGLFDGIDTKKIEENIPVAESVIKKNKEKNAYSMEDTKNLPYLRDGLAAFYALSEAGNHKAANAARKIAYTPLAQTEQKQETESKTPDFFGTSLKKSDITPAVLRGQSKQKNNFEQLSYSTSVESDVGSNIFKDEYFVFGKENQPSVVTKDSFPDSKDNYTEYLAKKEVLPEGIFKRYLLSGAAKKQDTDSYSSENQIISTSDAATLASNVYVLSKHNGSKPEDVGDWKYLYSHSNSESLQIAVYRKVKNGKTYYALVNAGTEGKEVPKEFISDWTNNLQQSFGMSDDMKDSIEFAQKFVAGRPDTEIIFIGHSKGGAEAAANAVATNCNAIIFNPARANYEAYGLDRDGYTGNITAFVVEGEPLDVGLDALSSFLWFIPQQEANTYELKKEKKSNSHSKNPFKEIKRNIDESLYLHSMDSIIDILKE